MFISLFVSCSVEVFIPLFVDDSDLLLLFLSFLLHGVSVARRLVPQHEALCNNSRLNAAIEEARVAISANPSIFGCTAFSSLLELLLRTPVHVFPPGRVADVVGCETGRKSLH